MEYEKEKRKSMIFHNLENILKIYNVFSVCIYDLLQQRHFFSFKSKFNKKSSRRRRNNEKQTHFNFPHFICLKVWCTIMMNDTNTTTELLKKIKKRLQVTNTHV